MARMHSVPLFRSPDQQHGATSFLWQTARFCNQSLISWLRPNCSGPVSGKSVQPLPAFAQSCARGAGQYMYSADCSKVGFFNPLDSDPRECRGLLDIAYERKCTTAEDGTSFRLGQKCSLSWKWWSGYDNSNCPHNKEHGSGSAAGFANVNCLSAFRPQYQAKATFEFFGPGCDKVYTGCGAPSSMSTPLQNGTCYQYGTGAFTYYTVQFGPADD
eukprot:TRINITY_DN2402_c0_g1_i1.p1 TRINITY_DN2402_c0_g1~~TRINITY_DN2402_c0_g1_i1.p1  ORF type:complete len:215 (+),score=2.43 TRINITY_DN2402_c0_g1_i1:221-865(+)